MKDGSGSRNVIVNNHFPLTLFRDQEKTIASSTKRCQIDCNYQKVGGSSVPPSSSLPGVCGVLELEGVEEGGFGL